MFNFDLSKFDLSHFLMTIIAFVIGITIHEWAHAFTADRLGDRTPRSQGRVTLDPLAHLDPLGTALIVISSIFGSGFGWGKPVMTDPRQYRGNMRTGAFMVSLAGPLSNAVLAAILAQLLRFHLVKDDFYYTFVSTLVWENVLLCLFNLIPVYPLDGSKLLAYSLPEAMGDAYMNFMQRTGMIFLYLLVVSNALSYILSPAMMQMYDLLTGGA